MYVNQNALYHMEKQSIFFQDVKKGRLENVSNSELKHLLFSLSIL